VAVAVQETLKQAEQAAVVEGVLERKLTTPTEAAAGA
jgi:hypothetical protein